MGVLSGVYGRDEVYAKDCQLPRTRGSSAGATTSSRRISAGSATGAATTSEPFPYQLHSKYPFGGFGDAEHGLIDDSICSKGHR